MAQEMEEYLSIGQVLRPQGLHGQVKIRPDTDDPGRFLALDMIYVRLEDQLEQPLLNYYPGTKIWIRGGSGIA